MLCLSPNISFLPRVSGVYELDATNYGFVGILTQGRACGAQVDLEP